jgi:hypothetical protein
VQLILGGGAGTVIANNLLSMVGNGAFAGIMLDNFNEQTNPAESNFSNAMVTNNTVLCNNRCHFGINLGP